MLHGSNKPPVWVYPALDERFPPAAPDKVAMVHVGRLAQKLIDQGLVQPLIIAAPTDGGTGTPWGTLDLGKLVDAISATTGPQGVTVDLDQVGVVGHSAAGGYPGRGLDRVAEQGGKFNGHVIKVLGVTDTSMSIPSGQKYAKIPGVAIYALHKMGGGWTTGDNGASNTNFGKAIGATHKMDAANYLGNEKASDTVGGCLDNNGQEPLRVSCKIDVRRIIPTRASWEAASAYKRKQTLPDYHNDMVPMWFWWALPRVFPQ
jgi:hypothetical protein